MMPGRATGPRGRPAAPQQPPSIDFQAVNRVALHRLPDICARWLSGGRKEGDEWVCGDLSGKPGRSCKVNLVTGKWADFAADGASGGDVISLTAAIHNLSQGEAARRLADMLGIDLGGRHV
ncbi:hypothetical protein [Roseomonas indoligenes]|nr:hypothetical protein [Pararoseomonas indoligenes]